MSSSSEDELLRKYIRDMGNRSAPGPRLSCWPGIVTTTNPANLAVGKYLMMSPQAITGNPVEGGAATITSSGPPVPVLWIGPNTPVTGAKALVKRTGNRWVASQRVPRISPTCTIKITLRDGLYGRTLDYISGVYSYTGGFYYPCVGLTVTLTQGSSVLTAVTDSTGTAVFTSALSLTTGTLTCPAPTGRYGSISQAIGSYAIGSTTSFTYTIQPLTGYFRHRCLSAVYGAVSNSMKLTYSGFPTSSGYDPLSGLLIGSGTATLLKSNADALTPYGLTNATTTNLWRVCNDFESWSANIITMTGAGIVTDAGTGAIGNGAYGWGLGIDGDTLPAGFRNREVTEVYKNGTISSGPPWVISGPFTCGQETGSGTWTLSDITVP